MSGRGRKARQGRKRLDQYKQRNPVERRPPPGRPGQQRKRPPDEDEPAPRREPAPYVAPPEPERPAELLPTGREFRGLRLFPFQVQALDAIEAGNSVLVAAPTGSGKTLVADYAIDEAFEAGWRVVYTSPIKALSNQKYRDFRAEHGDQVGIMTGDVTINGDADLLIMTTEVFRNTLFDAPHRFDDFRFVIHDEIHYLDDEERGTVWEESIIHAPAQMRIVGLSATVPNVRELAGWIESLRAESVTVVEMKRRPVPLDHRLWIPDLGALPLVEGSQVLTEPFKLRRRMRRERSGERLLDWLRDEKLLPALVFCFSRRDCERHARDYRGRRLLDDAERRQMLDLFDDLAARYECAGSQALSLLRSLAESGVSYHHAGMLPVHKEIVERLFTSGLVRVLFATETFSVGVNMPARTVVFLTLRKFDGERVDYMSCRDYGQMAGRAGRQGIDTHGLVVSMVSPRDDRESDVRRVLTGRSEPVVSRWNPDYSTILALYERMGDRVLATYQKSFARYQRARSSKAGRSDEERVLAARLSLLKATGYIEGDRLTDKGSFTSRVNGYEIRAGEFYGVGLLQRLNPRELGVLLISALYEPRPTDRWASPRDPRTRALENESVSLLERWRREEWRAGLTDLTPLPHFGLAAAFEAWYSGAPLASLGELTSTTPGDMVRNLRLLLQLCRQIRKALPSGDETTRVKLARLMDAVDRDEVDARRQLELGQDPTEEPPAPPSGP